MWILKALCILLWLLPFAALGYIVRWLKPEKLPAMSQAFYGGVLKILNIRVTLEGALVVDRPLLVLSNHMGYLDIPALGAMLPVAFAPKSDIAKWPIIGAMCRLTGCVFIDRRVSQTAQNRERLKAALASGQAIALFPEGTTGNGVRLLPFRSSYFSLADEIFDDRPLTIQPVTITYARIHNLPVDSISRSSLAWYGDMALLPHFKQLCRMGPVTLHITVLPPVEVAAGQDRKALALQCETAMQAEYERSISNVANS